MPKLLFRGSFIRFVDLRYSEDAARSHVRIDVTSDFSEPVAREMKWNPMSFAEELPAKIQDAIATYVREHGGFTKWLELAGLTQAKLKGRIAATVIELIPNGQLKENAISLEANEVRNFTLFRLLDKEGNTKSLELRFQVAVTHKGAAGILENYLDIVGQGVAQLKVGFAKQEDLDLEATGDEDKEEDGRLIDEEQAADTEGADEDQRPKGATLAPAVLVGGSHQARKNRPARDKAREAISDGTAPIEPVVN